MDLLRKISGTRTEERLHLLFTVFWFGPVMAVGMITSLGHSVAFVSFLSLWALGATHAGAWAAAKANRAAKEAAGHASEAKAHAKAARAIHDDIQEDIEQFKDGPGSVAE